MKMLQKLAAAMACTLAVASVALAQRDDPGRAGQRGGMLDSVRRVSKMIGAEVRDAGSDDRIADVNDLVMDERGRPQFLLIGRGGIAGVGEDVVVVPFGSADIAEIDDRGFFVTLPITAEELENAPTAEDIDRALADPIFRDDVYEHFNARAPQRPRDRLEREREGSGAAFVRASRLLDSEVKERTPRGESIADVEDLLLNNRYGAAVAVLGYGGVADVGENLVPVPFRALDLRFDDENNLRVSIDTTKDRLHNAPTLEGGDYEAILDGGFQARVREYFGELGGRDGAAGRRPRQARQAGVEVDVDREGDTVEVKKDGDGAR